MKSIFSIKTIHLLLFGLFAFLPNVFAAPGDWDPTFSQDGKIFNQFGSGASDTAFSNALLADGKILVAGTTSYGGSIACGLTRYNADGSLDSAFGVNGKKILQIQDSFSCYTLAIQPDGKIIIAGEKGRHYFPYGLFALAIVRLNADGSFDTTFDGDGIAITDGLRNVSSVAIQADGKFVVVANNSIYRFYSNGAFENAFFLPEIYTYSAIIQTDGKILALGTYDNGPNNDIGIYRLNTDLSLDTTFGGDGIVTTDPFSDNDFVHAYTIQPDGKIVVAASIWTTDPPSNFVLLRYNPDGSLDSTFDSDGKVIMPADFSFFANAVRVLPDGRIVLAGNGWINPSDIDFAVARFNADGSLDTTFGTGGKVLTDVQGNFDAIYSMVIQPDGKIVAAGTDVYSDVSDFAVARYNSEGALDTTFDKDGKTTTDIGIPPSKATAVATQPDGKIVAVGQSRNGSDQDFTVARYNADGTPDTSFDQDGAAFERFSSLRAFATSVAIQPDGKIVVAGYTDNAVGMGFHSALMRLNPDGTLDSTFDSDGKLVASELDSASDLVIQPDGKIITAGKSGSNAALARYNADGSLDTTFDGDGIAVTAIPNLPSLILSIALQADGKIAAAGESGFNTEANTTLFRYNANGTLDTTFDGDGIAITPVSNVYDTATAVQIQPDGKIVAAGLSANETEYGAFFSLVRYNADGSLDTTFDLDGKVTTSFLGNNYRSSVSAIIIQADGRILAAGSVSLPGAANKSVLAVYAPDGSLDHSSVTEDFSGFGDTTRDSLGRLVVVGESRGFFAVGRVLGTAAVSSSAPFDFDGDHKTDISIYRPSNGEWWINRSSTAGTVAGQFGAGTDQIVPGDYTGDGLVDIAVWRPSTGEWFILRSEDGSYYSIPFGLVGDVPVPADFDGDGRTDIAVWRPSTSVWYIIRSSGGYQFTTFGAADDQPTPGDYDHDGKSDIAVFRPSNGTWWILKSGTSATAVYQFGNSTDIPVQGDYTGDGRTDIAVWREQTGEWFIRRSEDGSFYSTRFGVTGDIPVPGDYDGDGKFDTAVFRPADTNWYINRSTAGLFIMSFGLAADRAVPSAYVP